MNEIIKKISCFAFCIPLLLLAQDPIIKGQLTYFNSGSQPASGIHVSADGIHTYSNDRGYFELLLPQYEIGDHVILDIKGIDRKNNVEIQVVNAKDIGRYIISKQETVLDIIVCKKGEIDEARIFYYEILINNLDAVYQIDMQLAKTQSELNNIQNLYSEEKRKAEDIAYTLANINKDDASSTLLNALSFIDEGKIDEAIATLDVSKLETEYQIGVDKIDDVILAFELLASLSNWKDFEVIVSSLESVIKKKKKHGFSSESIQENVLDILIALTIASKWESAISEFQSLRSDGTIDLEGSNDLLLAIYTIVAPCYFSMGQIDSANYYSSLASGMSNDDDINTLLSSQNSIYQLASISNHSDYNNDLEDTALKDSILTAVYFFNLSLAAYYQGDFIQADNYINNCLKHFYFEDPKDSLFLGIFYMQKAQTLSILDNGTEKTLYYFEEALRIMENCAPEESLLIAETHSKIASVKSYDPSFQESEILLHYEKMHEILKNSNSPLKYGLYASVLYDVCYENEEFADELYQYSIQGEKLVDKDNIQTISYYLAISFYLQDCKNNLSEAKKYALYALDLSKKINDSNIYNGIVYDHLTFIEYQEGNLDAAAKYGELSLVNLENFDKNIFSEDFFSTYYQLTKIYYEKKDYTKALLNGIQASYYVSDEEILCKEYDLYLYTAFSAKNIDDWYYTLYFCNKFLSCGNNTDIQNRFSILKYRAESYEKLEQYANAIIEFEMLIETYNDPSLKISLAQVYAQIDDYEKVQELALEAMKDLKETNKSKTYDYALCIYWVARSYEIEKGKEFSFTYYQMSLDLLSEINQNKSSLYLFIKDILEQ